MTKLKLSNCQLYTLVDDEDYEHLSQYKWRLGGNGYVNRDIWRNGKSNVISMHRQIMGLRQGDGKLVDHINRNPLDNRRKNLRIANKSLNALNAKIRSDNKSGIRNISFDKSKDKWRYSFKVDGRVYASRFSDFDEAVKAMEKRKQETKYAEVLGNHTSV